MTDETLTRFSIYVHTAKAGIQPDGTKKGPPSKEGGPYHTGGAAARSPHGGSYLRAHFCTQALLGQLRGRQAVLVSFFVGQRAISRAEDQLEGQ